MKSSTSIFEKKDKFIGIRMKEGFLSTKSACLVHS